MNGKFVSTNEYLTECPSCGKRKLYYNTVKDIGWCHVCERVYFKRDGIFHAGVEGTPLRKVSIGHGDMAYAWTVPEAREYLEGRRVSGLDALTCDIMYRPETKELVVPVTSPSPDIPPARMKRNIEGKGWYFEGGADKKPYCFGWEAVRDSGRTSCVLVEGIFDVLSPGLRGYGIALLGTSLFDLLGLWLELNMKVVYVWLDPGEREDLKARHMVKILKALGINAYYIRWGQEPGDCKKDSGLLYSVRGAIEGSQESFECLPCYC